MIDHVCAHMQKMSNMGKRSHTHILVVFYYAKKYFWDAISLWGPRPASWDQQFKQSYKN